MLVYIMSKLRQRWLIFPNMPRLQYLKDYVLIYSVGYLVQFSV